MTKFWLQKGLTIMDFYQSYWILFICVANQAQILRQKKQGNYLTSFLLLSYYVLLKKNVFSVN